MTEIMLPQRGKWQGAAEIVRFNRRFFLLAAFGAFIAAALAAWAPMPALLRLLVWAGATGTVVSAIVSILVSHWVYDRSVLYRWVWLTDAVPQPKRWVTIHAGLDESSEALKALYPRAHGTTVDIYDESAMTEPAIVVARNLAGRSDAIRARHDHLPIADANADLILMFFSAHELRTPKDREALLSEVRRALAPGGRAVVVEHTRDLANFLAFGPGALHFYPRHEWLRVAHRTGLRIQSERRITPFVWCSVMEAR